MQGQRGPRLPAKDLLQQQAAHGKFRVVEIFMTDAQFLCHTISPTAYSARAPRIGVADTFRKRIPQGNVPAPRVVTGTYLVPCDKNATGAPTAPHAHAIPGHPPHLPYRKPAALSMTTAGTANLFPFPFPDGIPDGT